MTNDCHDVLRIIRDLAAARRGPSALGAPKPMAGEIAKLTGWPGISESGGGSAKRLNDALQRLRHEGKVQYVKGTGWVEVVEEKE